MLTKRAGRLGLSIGVAVMTCAAIPIGAQSAAPDAKQEETGRSAYANAQVQDSLKKMKPVERLQAMEEIRVLPLQYARCITQKDWECLKNVFAPDFYYLDGPARVHGWSGFIDVMKRSGCYDRLLCRVNIHGHEIELLSPTTARGIAAADFSYYYPPGQSFPTTGKEVAAPGEQSDTPTYYYQTYEKIDGVWRLRTSDHLSFDLRRDFHAHTIVYDKAYVTPDGVRPQQR